MKVVKSEVRKGEDLRTGQGKKKRHWIFYRPIDTDATNPCKTGTRGTSSEEARTATAVTQLLRGFPQTLRKMQRCYVIHPFQFITEYSVEPFGATNSAVNKLNRTTNLLCSQHKGQVNKRLSASSRNSSPWI